MISCTVCGGVILPLNKISGYAGPVCRCYYSTDSGFKKRLRDSETIIKKSNDKCIITVIF